MRKYLQRTWGVPVYIARHLECLTILLKVLYNICALSVKFITYKVITVSICLSLSNYIYACAVY